MGFNIDKMELSTYESALQNYFSGLNIAKSPISFWDIYGSFLDSLKGTFSDINILQDIAKINKWKMNWNIEKELHDDTVIVVTDVNLKIVFASENIIEMNGYKPTEVVGNHPKMFQGQDTEIETSNYIGNAIKKQVPFDKIVTNYRKDGSLYKCHIKGFPVFDTKGNLKNFIAFEKTAA